MQDATKYWEKVKQSDRICCYCGIEVYPWEGDLSISKKKAGYLLAQRMLSKA